METLKCRDFYFPTSGQDGGGGLLQYCFLCKSLMSCPKLCFCRMPNHSHDVHKDLLLLLLKTPLETPSSNFAQHPESGCPVCFFYKSEAQHLWISPGLCCLLLHSDAFHSPSCPMTLYLMPFFRFMHMREGSMCFKLTITLFSYPFYMSLGLILLFFFILYIYMKKLIYNT